MTITTRIRTRSHKNLSKSRKRTRSRRTLTTTSRMIRDKISSLSNSHLTAWCLLECRTIQAPASCLRLKSSRSSMQKVTQSLLTSECLSQKSCVRYTPTNPSTSSTLQSLTLNSKNGVSLTGHSDWLRRRSQWHNIRTTKVGTTPPLQWITFLTCTMELEETQTCMTQPTMETMQETAPLRSNAQSVLTSILLITAFVNCVRISCEQPINT